MDKKDIPVVILAGGRGTRLMEETSVIPKPMVTIGGKPILLHIMLHYSYYGFRKFVVCLGYKGFVIKDYFRDIHRHTASFRVLTKEQRVEYEPMGEVLDWDIALVETGESSLTARRISLIRDYVDAPVFALTYGDGLSDVNLDTLLDFHLAHRAVGTMTAVHPPSRFGMMEMADNGQVVSFREKEKLHHDYINGGFFFFNRTLFDRLPSGENLSFESEPLTKLAESGQLYAFRHEGFWKCMDTMRDREELEGIYEQK